MTLSPFTGGCGMTHLTQRFVRTVRAPWWGALVGLFGLIALAACGGTTAGSDSAAGGATVTLAMTDAPSDAFEAVTVTVASAALIGPTGSFSIPFSDGGPSGRAAWRERGGNSG